MKNPLLTFILVISIAILIIYLDIVFVVIPREQPVVAPTVLLPTAGLTSVLTLQVVQ